MNKKLIILIITSALIFSFPSQPFAGFPIMDEETSYTTKAVKLSNLTVTHSLVEFNIITYKPLVLEERNSLFSAWKNVVYSHKKISCL